MEKKTLCNLGEDIATKINHSGKKNPKICLSYQSPGCQRHVELQIQVPSN
jgi:hypothetical protein